MTGILIKRGNLETDTHTHTHTHTHTGRTLSEEEGSDVETDANECQAL